MRMIHLSCPTQPSGAKDDDLPAIEHVKEAASEDHLLFDGIEQNKEKDVEVSSQCGALGGIGIGCDEISESHVPTVR